MILIPCAAVIYPLFSPGLALSWIQVRYCHIDDGCKFAIGGLQGTWNRMSPQRDC
ncbi:hypothetical protein BJV78DRAFT_1169529 [Lactifluus subvellereus]|nr:hypothetical protein BJV78DRAFT_1169529 [Lactifluus subvellereus]